MLFDILFCLWRKCLLLLVGWEGQWADHLTTLTQYLSPALFLGRLDKRRLLTKELIALVSHKVFYDDRARSSILHSKLGLVRLLSLRGFVLSSTFELTESCFSGPWRELRDAGLLYIDIPLMWWKHIFDEVWFYFKTWRTVNCLIWFIHTPLKRTIKVSQLATNLGSSDLIHRRGQVYMAVAWRCHHIQRGKVWRLQHLWGTMLYWVVGTLEFRCEIWLLR